MHKDKSAKPYTAAENKAFHAKKKAKGKKAGKKSKFGKKKEIPMKHGKSAMMKRMESYEM